MIKKKKEIRQKKYQLIIFEILDVLGSRPRHLNSCFISILNMILLLNESQTLIYIHRKNEIEMIFRLCLKIFQTHQNKKL